jgi:hypothetical protein
MQSTRISKGTHLELQKFKGGNLFFNFVKNHTFLFSGNRGRGIFKRSGTEICLKQGWNETGLQNVFQYRNIAT